MFSTYIYASFIYLIVQACQGVMLDPGATVMQCTETDSPSLPRSYRLPTYADFLLVHSTVPGNRFLNYVSEHVALMTFKIQATCLGAIYMSYVWPVAHFAMKQPVVSVGR